MTITNSLWVERYRPETLDGYVFIDPHQKAQIERWIDQKDIPHILFSGGPGTGKTTLAKILVHELGIDPYDYMYVNASLENNVDNMRNKITSFVSTMPFGDKKIVLLDEADYLTQYAQAPLRVILEQYSMSSRFILTCNYPNRIIPPIHSRMQEIPINKLDMNEFTVRVAEILVAEKVEFEVDVLDDYVRGCWPDLRKCINNCQLNSLAWKLIKPDHTDASRDYRIDAVELFKNGKFREARTLICSQLRAEELEEFFTWLYNNLDFWGTTNQQKDAAILVLRKGMVQIPVTADPEILVAAALVELGQIANATD
jgi:replication factor C small subunit